MSRPLWHPQGPRPFTRRQWLRLRRVKTVGLAGAWHGFFREKLLETMSVPMKYREDQGNFMGVSPVVFVEFPVLFVFSSSNLSNGKGSWWLGDWTIFPTTKRSGAHGSGVMKQTQSTSRHATPGTEVMNILWAAGHPIAMSHFFSSPESQPHGFQ